MYLAKMKSLSLSETGIFFKLKSEDCNCEMDASENRVFSPVNTTLFKMAPEADSLADIFGPELKYEVIPAIPNPPPRSRKKLRSPVMTARSPVFDCTKRPTRTDEELNN